MYSLEKKCIQIDTVLNSSSDEYRHDAYIHPMTNWEKHFEMLFVNTKEVILTSRRGISKNIGSNLVLERYNTRFDLKLPHFFEDILHK